MSTATPRLAALRNHDFRLLWTGQVLSTLGTQMQLTAINWHVYALLRGQTYSITLFGRAIPLGAEALGLGTLGLVRIVPVLIFALAGGLLADTLDRRRLMIITNVVQIIPAALLAALSFIGRETVWVLYLLTAIGAAAGTFETPARQSLVPNIVPREQMTNAVSLVTLSWQIGQIVGPALAGVLLAQLNIGVVYAFNVVSFVAIVVALLRMRYRGGAAERPAGLGPGAVLEGFRFVYREKIVWGTMLLDFFATFFSSARTMLPIVAGDVLGIGEIGYGLLSAAQPVGALVAGAITSLRGEIRRQGIVLLASVAVYGVATALFGVSVSTALSFVLLALTGAGDTVSTVIRGTIRQVVTPDRLRGRMVGVNMMFFMGGPQLGELEAGLVASLLGAPLAILTGGIATVLLTALIAWRYPRLRNYTADMMAAAAD